MRGLLVENDTPLSELIISGLTENHHIIDWVEDGILAKQVIDSKVFDIIILDLGLPSISGLELLKYIRENETANKDTPVLILTARDEIDARVQGLDSGADDYLSKPCTLEELEARMRALYRRRIGIASTIITRKNLVLNTSSYQLTLDGQPIMLPRREFCILQKLLENQGRVISREKIAQLLYGWEGEINSNAIEVHIHNLRKKLGSSLIRTIRGIGYIISKINDAQK